MRGFLIRVLICSAGLWLASWLVPGVQVLSPLGLVLAALLLGIVNALVRPLLILLTLPLTVLTLGLFLLVINAAMVGLVAAFIDDFVVGGFFSAMFTAIIVSITGMLASWTIGPKGRYELIVARRRDGDRD